MPDPLARLLAREGDAPPRVLVVVAHPDDEVLGCGALLVRLPAVRVIHVTDGAPRDPAHARHHGFASPADYAAARAREAEEALALAGHPAACLARLGIADQEAPANLAAIARRLAPALAGADIVLTHAYEGGHGDHDAVAFAVAAAARLNDPPAPPIVEMPFYRATLESDEHGASSPGGTAEQRADEGSGALSPSGPSVPSSLEGGGAQPAGDAREGWMCQRFVPHPQAGVERRLHLDDAEQTLKRRMLAAHRTQAETLRAFAVEVERYRLAPAHDFAVLPHGGALLYERHGWTLTGPLWLQHVAAAAAELRRAGAR